MKTILAIWHSGNKGKTETLRELASLLLATYPTHTPVFPLPVAIQHTGDFRLVINIGGKIVGVESQGDPKTNLESRLIDLADNFHCDIIFCCSRTRGETVDAIVHVANTYGFEIIWTSTYDITDLSQHAFFNRRKAEHLLDLMRSSGRI